MASFEEIMKRPGSAIQAPQAYPVGTYHCIVDGPAEPGKSSQKQTDFWRFRFKVVGIDKDVDAKAAAEQQIVGKVIAAEYYVTEDAVWRLKEMLQNLGITGLDDTKNLEEGVSEAPGKQVWVKLRHEASPDGKRVFHRVASTAHV